MVFLVSASSLSHEDRSHKYGIHIYMRKKDTCIKNLMYFRPNKIRFVY